MLSAYLDETGHSADPNKLFVGMAGLLSSESSWAKFDLEWRAVSEKHEVILPFHMMDLAHFGGQFENWESDGDVKRKQFLSELIGPISGAAPILVGAIVSVEEFRQLTKDEQCALQDPYYIAFQECTFQLAFAAALLQYPPRQISMVYAAHGEFRRAEDLWEAIKKHNLVGHCMGSYSRGEPRDFTPLQAADLWAYELGHHFYHILPKGKEFRWPLRELLKIAVRTSVGQRFFTYFDREEMLLRLGKI